MAIMIGISVTKACNYELSIALLYFMWANQKHLQFCVCICHAVLLVNRTVLCLSCSTYLLLHGWSVIW